jgi:hypothetical protein
VAVDQGRAAVADLAATPVQPGDQAAVSA